MQWMGSPTMDFNGCTGDSESSSEEEVIDKDQITNEKIEKYLKSKSDKKQNKKQPKQERMPLSTEVMFNKLIEKIGNLEEAISFNNEIMEKMKESLDDPKKENRNIKKEQEKQRLEIKQFHDEIAVIKGKTTQTKNIIFGINDEQEILKVLDHIVLKVEKENMKVKRLPSKKPMKPYVVTFKEEQMRNLVLTNRKIKGLLKSSAINLEGTERNIFINEDQLKLIQDFIF
ncbi:hypothetical protein HHI36_000493 [Cryptolaemus montrouzieri]|uniref:Uncharacterized protein n=1 Tax=Cryptolaemus montrouzieri TaxID=559131 RepID=A0ABD2P4S9_9CUCU